MEYIVEGSRPRGIDLEDFDGGCTKRL